MTELSVEPREGFAPCPICKQYSHSIGDGRITEAFNHFQSMVAHPVRGHPMGYAFDERTRDMAQVLLSAIRPEQTLSPSMRVVEALREARAIRDYLLACSAEADRQRLNLLSVGNKLTARECGSESKAYANAAAMIELEDHASYRCLASIGDEGDAG